MPSDKSWIEQSEPGGQVFTDSYLHNECSYIRHWDSRDEWLKQLKERNTNADSDSKCS